jgi:hypothetical protein
MTGFIRIIKDVEGRGHGLYYTSTGLQELRENKDYLKQNRWSLGQDMNPEFSKYKAEMLTIWTRRSAPHYEFHLHWYVHLTASIIYPLVNSVFIFITYHLLKE